MEDRIAMAGFVGGSNPDPLPAMNTYLVPLRNALRNKFNELTDPADKARFWSAMIGIRAAFDNYMPKAVIRGLVSQIYIGIGGPDDEENRPDLRQLQNEMLALPEWDL